MTPARLVSASTQLFGVVGTGRPAGVVSARCWVLRGQTFCLNPLGLLSFPCLGLREGYRPYFENYTVDASIFGPTFGLVHEDDLKDH